MDIAEARVDSDSALLCLARMMVFLDRPADPDQLRHASGKGSAALDADDIVRLAKSVGIKAKKATALGAKIERVPLPAIAHMTDGKYIVLMKASGDKVLVFRSDRDGPTTIDREEFDRTFTGAVILMTTREQVVASQRAFDVTWFIPAIVRYRHVLRDVLLASVFIQLFALISPLFFQVVVDKVLVHKGLTTLEILVVGLLIVSLFDVVVGTLRTYLMAHTTSRVDAELGAKLFNHLMHLPLSYFQARRVGDSVARVRELDTIREFLTSSAVTLIVDLAFASIFLAVMYFYSPPLLLIVLITLPLYALIVLSLSPFLMAKTNEKFARGAENQSFLVESITGVETLKAMAVEPQMQSRWERQLAGYVKTGFEAGMVANVGRQLIELVQKLSTVGILGFGALQVIEGRLTVGELIAFNMLASQVSGPVLRLSQLAQNFQQARIAVDRLGDILNSPVEADVGAARTRLPAIAGAIQFDNVTFRYRPDRPEVLKDVSVSIAPGEVLGVVGPSGSGKSTLAKLVQRLHTPERGRVLIDGVDLGMADPAWLRRQVGVVLQENILFNRSVRENIALADPAMPIEHVVEAAKMAGAHEFVLELPEAYDTRIDERGGNLSGGQRQRMAIARALAINPRILIFDEATSALDAESEEIIQTNLKAMSQGRTVIIIAHRLSAVRQADRIITLERGAIVEAGSHAELLMRGGRYASLYQKQMGGSLPEVRQ